MTIPKTIFPKLTIRRDQIHWEDFLFVETPVERVGNMLFKREDYFAPLGYGGINGSKLRQAIYLVHEYFKKELPGKLVSGASVKSPQLPMSSAVATHYGYKSLHVIGATKPETAINHENVKMATWFGAAFDIIKVGYNPVLQNRVTKLLTTDDYYLHYGITPDPTSNSSEILNFHMLGASQTISISEDVEDLVIPAGSCNSCISVILGVMLDRPKGLKRIHLLGIGPNKLKFINDRLTMLTQVLGVNMLNFNLKFETKDLISQPEKGALDLYYYDLHKENFTDYQQEMPFNYGGIEFHPTYEGKCISYLFLNLPHLEKPTTLFWIVGSKPRIKDMESLPDMCVLPTKINLYEQVV